MSGLHAIILPARRAVSLMRVEGTASHSLTNRDNRIVAVGAAPHSVTCEERREGPERSGGPDRLREEGKSKLCDSGERNVVFVVVTQRPDVQ